MTSHERYCLLLTSVSSAIDRVAIQLWEEVDPAMMTVGWATAVTVWIDNRKEGIQVLCVLAERRAAARRHRRR